MLGWIIILLVAATAQESCRLRWKHESHMAMVLECQVKEITPCSAVQLLDEKNKFMAKLPAEAATADPSRNGYCRFNYMVSSKFVHQYLAVLNDEVVSVQAPIAATTGTQPSELEFFIVSKQTPEVLQYIHRIDQQARVLELTDPKAQISLQGSNLSSVHNDRISISYGNSTLKLGSNRNYQLKAGKYLSVTDGAISLPSNGYLRITHQGLVSYYEEEFSYSLQTSCSCNLNQHVINSRFAWFRGLCPNSKYLSRGFSLVECPADDHWKSQKHIAIGLTANSPSLLNFKLLEKHYTNMDVLYVVEKEPLTLQDILLLAVLYPARWLFVVPVHLDRHLTEMLLSKEQRHKPVLEHNYTGGLSIAFSNIGLYTYRPYLPNHNFTYSQQRLILRVNDLNELSFLNSTNKLFVVGPASGIYDNDMRSYTVSLDSGLTIVRGTTYQPYRIQYVDLASLNVTQLSDLSIIRDVSVFEFTIKFLLHPSSVLQYVSLLVVLLQIVLVACMWLRLRFRIKAILAQKRRKQQQPYITVNVEEGTKTSLSEQQITEA